MPRKARMYLEGVPCHVIQRGNNRQACFYADEDYSAHMNWMSDACRRYGAKIHAYVLMTNHVHLLMTPEHADSVSAVMQSVGRRYVQYINHTYRRSGTLWEGRHKASLIDAESYLFACHRYIEMNPVAAGMVKHPGDYRWSSYHCNAEGKSDALVTAHAEYFLLGSSDNERNENYRALFATVLSQETLHEIRVAAEFSMPLGDSRFVGQIEEAIGRKLGFAKRGRSMRVERTR